MNIGELNTVSTVLALGAVLGLGLACGAPDSSLGPKDGSEPPATDLERVKVGDMAPDFTLESQDGTAVTLSDYRAKKDVILVFYRGHW